MQGWRYKTQDPNSFQPEGEQIMKLTIDQKFISIGNKTAVVDETGKQWFRCQGKLFRFNPNFCIYDLYEQPIFYIKKRYFRLLGRFDLYRGDRQSKFGTMKGRLHAPLTRRFRMDTDMGKYYVIEGKWNSSAYAVTGAGWKFDKKHPELKMHKKFFHIRDRFFVDFDETKMDPAIATIIGLVNDMIFHNK